MMDKINPALYITDTDPIPQEIFDTTDWYESQETTIQDPDQLPWMMAQGWIIDEAVVTGYWTSTGKPIGTWTLSRRVLKPEEALKDLTESFIEAYNTGRELNDTRYDEIVTLYSVMLDKTEDELNSLESDDTTYDDLIDNILAAMETDFAEYDGNVDGLFDSYGNAQRTRINQQFDNQVAEQRSSLIDRGMYNSTLWNTTEAGIERERARALTDLEDSILERKVGLEDRQYTLKSEMRGRILAARDRLRASLQDRDTNHITLRNNVLNALLAFMERREDGYPDIGSVGQLTSNLGASSPTYPAP